jgi:hypothetical protein
MGRLPKVSVAQRRAGSFVLLGGWFRFTLDFSNFFWAVSGCVGGALIRFCVDPMGVFDSSQDLTVRSEWNRQASRCFRGFNP